LNQTQLFSHIDIENYNKMQQEIIKITDSEMIDYFNDETAVYQYTQLYPESQITVMESQKLIHDVAEAEEHFSTNSDANAQPEVISFAKWKESLKDKWVKYSWSDPRLEKTKNFETCRFYSNKDGKMISMPKFMLGKEQKFSKIDDKTYKTESDHGQVIYTILGDTKPCPTCNSTEFVVKKTWNLECHNDNGHAKNISMVKYS
jgi:hypothetical protein